MKNRLVSPSLVWKDGCLKASIRVHTNWVTQASSVAIRAMTRSRLQGTDAEGTAVRVAAGAGDAASCGCVKGCGEAVMLVGEGAGTGLGKPAAGTV